MATGTTEIDFGAFPGASDAVVNVTGQSGISSGSYLEAWLYPADTTDHLADEHLLETIKVVAGNIIAGTGFTIYGVNTSQLNEPLTPESPSKFRSAATSVYGFVGNSIGGLGTLIYGKWSVRWVWV